MQLISWQFTVNVMTANESCVYEYDAEMKMQSSEYKTRTERKCCVVGWQEKSIGVFVSAIEVKRKSFKNISIKLFECIFRKGIPKLTECTNFLEWLLHGYSKNRLELKLFYCFVIICLKNVFHLSWAKLYFHYENENGYSQCPCC